jgi:TonB-dependent SusC/RagA subfamily outer membrane receptor
MSIWDGAAAAIYGARAANGVVLITTKRGKSGKPSFSFEAYSGIQNVVNLPTLLNSEQYLTIRNEAITNELVSHYGNVVLMKPPFNPATYFLWFGPFLILLYAIRLAYGLFKQPLKSKNS